MKTGLASLYRNHALANLAYLLVLALGVLAYGRLPREAYPESTQKAVSLIVALPGVSAEDIERRVLVPIERMLRAKIKDIRHLDSDAQAGQANFVLLFADIGRGLYDRRVAELRREIQSLAQAELPREAFVDLYEGGATSDYYKLVVYGPGEDEHFRRQARLVRRDLLGLPGVLRVDPYGVEDPELDIVFRPERLAALGLGPAALADTVRAYFRDTAAGTARIEHRDWMVRVAGTDDPVERLAGLPILAARGLVRLGDLAEFTRSSKAVRNAQRFMGQPAAVLVVFKQPGANTLELLDRVKAYLEARNRAADTTGAKLYLLTDTSARVRASIRVMEEHAWSGMALVCAVALLLLGVRPALLTTLAVPFSLAGMFVVLQASGHSLNLSVLFGVVIALGMLVDDAVVVMEAVAQQARRGLAALAAVTAAVREVWIPVATSSLTTMAGFLPLLLLGAEGALGAVIGIVPAVVCLALGVSLVQALWLLPAHAVPWIGRVSADARPAGRRERWLHALQLRYARALLAVLRAPGRSFALLLAVFALAGAALALGWVRYEFFPAEAQYGFGVTVEMPSGTPAEETLAALADIERRARRLFRPGELRNSLAETGTLLRNGRQLIGNQYGDVWFDLDPDRSRPAAELLREIKPALAGLPGPLAVSFDGETAGPAGKPISLRVGGSDEQETAAALRELRAILAELPAVGAVATDSQAGQPELKLRLNGEAVQRAGVNPDEVVRALQLLAGGELVGGFQESGETVGVRVRAGDGGAHDIEALLGHTVPRPDGHPVPLRELVYGEKREGPALIRHYDFRRVTTLEADLDQARMDTLSVNRILQERWRQVGDRYPGVTVDFTGELESIELGLANLGQQFVLGIGLIFLVLGAQFRGYLQPCLILLKVPMAFTGVVFGLLASGYPASLYTLYGGVALAGIAINSAILLFAAANDRLEAGMGVLHATVYAARRRLLPIVITSLTTLSGLLPLALGGEREAAAWQPVATAIVWGMAFSTLLTLFVVPLLYHRAMSWAGRGRGAGGKP